eukprot:716519-Prymnesium_polylepis.2
MMLIREDRVLPRDTVEALDGPPHVLQVDPRTGAVCPLGRFTGRLVRVVVQLGKVPPCVHKASWSDVEGPPSIRNP